MPAAHYLTRRTVLCAGGAEAAGLCVFVLTGCSSGSSASATTSAPPSTGSASAEGSTSSGGRDISRRRDVGRPLQRRLPRAAVASR